MSVVIGSAVTNRRYKLAATGVLFIQIVARVVVGKIAEVRF